MIVEKKTFELPQHMTRSGALLKRVRVGWESYGTLDRERSNAILVTHYFSATSHAAGRYTAHDELPGISPGARARDAATINPWPSRPLLGDEQLPLMSACPVAALPNARLPPATHLIAQWGA
jgi:hypothetical protein